MLARSLFTILREAVAIVEKAADAAKKKLPSGWKAIAKYLTPEERGTERINLVTNIVSLFKSLPKDEEFIAAAKGGEAKRGWYAQSAQALQELFGPDTPRFCAVLAGLSPQVSVVENLRNATRVWRRYLAAGRPTDEKAIDQIGIGAVGEERWHKMGWKNNVVTALTTAEGDLPKLSLSGNKVNNFRRNLLGDLAGVTCDAWMANFALVDQQMFGSLGGYSAYTAKVRRVAEKLGWQPAEVQETVWSFFKALYEKQVAGKQGREAMTDLKDSDISDVPDFATLMMEDDDVRSELERLGLGSTLARAGKAGADVRGGGGSEQSPLSRIEQAGLAGHVGGIADRATELQRQRFLAEDIKFSYPLHHAVITSQRGGYAVLRVTDAAEVAALQRLASGQPLTRVVSTQKYKSQARPMKFIMVPKQGKWLFIKDPKATLLKPTPDGATEVHVAGTLKLVAVPPNLEIPA